MKAIGHDLTNFLDWCEARAMDWREISYRDLVQHYQGDMQAGKWNQRQRGVPLASSTINRRILFVCDFLSFAAQKGYRGTFEVDYLTVPDPRQKSSFTKSRDGKVRQHPRDLRLPTMEEAGQWLEALKSERGRTPHLMAKSAIGIGLRAEELLLLRAEQVPPMPKRDVRTVAMRVCYGTKGGRNPHDAEKKGKLRDVRVPVELLAELQGYMSGHRKLCLKRFRDRNQGMSPPKELFLSKHTGRPLSYSRFYALWRSVELPFKGFSPHAARHMWACYTLVEKIREEVELSTGVDGPLRGIAANMHETLIQTYIMPQLGHVDEVTSQRYLRWVVELFDMTSPRESWWDFLNE